MLVRCCKVERRDGTGQRAANHGKSSASSRPQLRAVSRSRSRLSPTVETRRAAPMRLYTNRVADAAGEGMTGQGTAGERRMDEGERVFQDGCKSMNVLVSVCTLGSWFVLEGYVPRACCWAVCTGHLSRVSLLPFLSSFPFPCAAA